MGSTKTQENGLSEAGDGLAKSYDPASVEPRIRARWDEAAAFHVEPSDPGEPYSLVIPPPNVTAALHLGHAFNNTLQDILTRYHRARGYKALWMPGTDHAGIATQTVVEKRVMAEEGRRRVDFERSEFVAKIQAWKDEYEATIIDQLKLMGCSCDWERTRFTMDEQCARAVREAFFRLFKDGLIYRGKRLVNWDPVTQTALADDEVEMEEVEGHFWYLRYPLVHPSTNHDDPLDCQEVTWSELAARGYPEAEKHPEDENAWVTVATTRPETYLGDTAVAVNPDDPRAGALRGLWVQLPLVGRVIPVIEDDYVVQPDAESEDSKARYATGFLKVTPAHDPNDWDIGQRHGLAAINVMAPDASISDAHGWEDIGDAHLFVGMSREKARKKVVEEFKARGLLENVKPYRHSVGHSYRSHSAIEPYLSDQWYVKVTDDRLRGNALRAMATSRAREEAVEDDNTGCSEQIPRSITYPVYFLTWTTYGTWLHGDERGSVDRHQNQPQTEFVDVDSRRERNEFERSKGDAVTLGAAQRTIVRDKVLEVCQHRGWTLLAVNVRSNHVHVVVIAAEKEPERVMNDLKSYATRGLTETGTVLQAVKVWTRHGSTRYLNDEGSVIAACRYVLAEQGANTGNEIGGTCVRSGRSTPLPHGRGSLSESNDDWEGTLQFHPPRYAKTFQNWHENLRDWCISRQLWWGHRIPVWSREKDGRPVDITLAGDMSMRSDEQFVHICLRDDDAQTITELEQAGFVQDPDVLDTWFSSALWPMSTMGWPEETELLATFNPTNVLSTGRDIITLWVSRMVMFNTYFMDRLPFKDVFIHAMIQDGEGRKMSKSLGNGVDPRDILKSRGADAMRFTLAHMATNTQDVRLPVELDEKLGANTSPKFELGGRLANKLWNATRFALGTLNAVDPATASTDDELMLIDRWMLSRLARSSRGIEQAVATYSFNTYAQVIYDLFWREMCDWYLEGIKPTVRNSAKQCAILATVLRCVHRMFHPLMPFITEELFPAVEGTAWPSVPGVELETAELAALAPWPVISESLIDEEAEHEFGRIQELVSEIRNVRSAQQVADRRRVVLHVRNASIMTLIESGSGVVEALAGLERVTEDAAESEGVRFQFESVELELSGLRDQVDIAAERARLEKQHAEVSGRIKALQGRLSNEGYVSRAPAHLVEETRQQMAQFEQDLVVVEESLARLGGGA